ncbi:MAG TPA: acylphosphatase, partial [Mizugakiibacter sp.]|nr:acylphosphatase [Mizugakiibacter sp.]
MNAVRFLVEGRVQGVAFRAATRTEALRLGLA